MMKKIIIVFASLLILLILSSCSLITLESLFPGITENYSDWKSVEVESVGTFKIPKDWVFTAIEKEVYLTDGPISENEYKIYLMGAIYDKEYSMEECKRNVFALFENTIYKEPGRGTMFSNCAWYGLELVEISGNLLIKVKPQNEDFGR